MTQNTLKITNQKFKKKVNSESEFNADYEI